MNFGANKKPIEVINVGALGGAYVRDIYFGVNGKWYKKYLSSWKILIKNIIVQIIMMLLINDVNKYGVKCGTLLRFWENKGWIYFYVHIYWCIYNM